MVLVKHFPDKTVVQMGVNLRGGNAFMPEQNLHETQVMGFQNKMGGAGMSEAVWCDVHLFA